MTSDVPTSSENNIRIQVAVVEEARSSCFVSFYFLDILVQNPNRPGRAIRCTAERSANSDKPIYLVLCVKSF